MQEYGQETGGYLLAAHAPHAYGGAGMGWRNLTGEPARSALEDELVRPPHALDQGKADEDTE